MLRTAIASATIGLVLVSAPAAFAQDPCDAYSGECPPSGTVTVRPSATDQPSVEGTTQTRGGGVTLPLTGGELAALLLVGALAIGGGATLVLAGRRGNHTP